MDSEVGRRCLTCRRRNRLHIPAESATLRFLAAMRKEFRSACAHDGAAAASRPQARLQPRAAQDDPGARCNRLGRLRSIGVAENVIAGVEFVDGGGHASARCGRRAGWMLACADMPRSGLADNAHTPIRASPRRKTCKESRCVVRSHIPGCSLCLSRPDSRPWPDPRRHGKPRQSPRHRRSVIPVATA